jgi:CNT family concentrative nucleoside transporter
MSFYNIVSFTGIFILTAFAYLLSENRKMVNFRVVAWGILFQLIFALFVFVFPAGTTIFLWINDGVVALLDSAAAGSRFLFGRLALAPGMTDEFGQPSLGFFLAFQALPTIVFFSALMSILYYYNVMQRLIRLFAWAFTNTMRISGAESLATASNIFVGVESSLTIRPFLAKMTRSELAVVLTAGMATVASNVLGIYVFSLKELFPTIAGHLISASFLSAPAAIVMAKLLVPESGTPETLGKNIHPHYEREESLFSAIISGSEAGVKLIVGIAALLLAVLGLVALADMVLLKFGGFVNGLTGITFDWSIKALLGWVAYPFTLIMGVPVEDATAIAKLIGERTIVTEVAAYQDLALLLKENALLHPRSAVIAAYALCGFAHVASLSIFIGGTAALVPSRRDDLARVGLRALLAATLATMMTAAVAGTFYSEATLILR